MKDDRNNANIRLRCWWIDEPKISGTSNPTTKQLKELYKEGFRSIISLLDEEESPYYDTEEVEKTGFKRSSIPLKDYSAPTLNDFQQFLKTVEEYLNNGKVLVHCMGGSGRTGTMAAAYWIKKGLSAEEAVKKIRQSNPKAIETDQQENSLHELEQLIKSRNYN